MTATTDTRAAARQLSAQALAVMDRFPPRPVPMSWDATAADRFTVARRMLAPPFALDDIKSRYWRKLGMLKILDWLELHSGSTWQQRWDFSGAGSGRPGDWRDRVVADLKASGRLGPRGSDIHARLGAGMVQLIGGDVIRPGLPWLLTTPAPARFAHEMGRVRDPAGIEALPVTGFGAPAARDDRRAARGRDVCSRCLAVSWIQQLKSLASARDAQSHPTPTASRNRHHRSRSTEYDLSVDSDFPDASRSRRKTDTGSTTSPPGPAT